MPKISKQKIQKIKEQILFYLYSTFPNQPFTSDIATELARDEEFIKIQLIELEKEKLIIKINRNPEGVVYLRRLRWRISNKVHEAYSENQ
ncbi:hypothetical protein CMI41_02930 [Candidatus Pacearchaeota archaeon]|nr:hypothetical protein [Candidatus Pacearchaeota archaeon]|tara:strand:+ start:6307 stop:6576 length:270 start_codon:yes stop_codon:yes gene_type:complete